MWWPLQLYHLSLKGERVCGKERKTRNTPCLKNGSVPIGVPRLQETVHLPLPNPPWISPAEIHTDLWVAVCCEFLLPTWAGRNSKTLRILLSELMGIKYLSGWVQMCLIQIVIFLFAASLSMMNDWSQRSGVINGSTLAPLHALLILLLYYSYNPAGCFALPTSHFLGEGLLPRSPIYGEGEGSIILP